MNSVWSASIKDDVSSVAGKMSNSLITLDKTASMLFKASDGNFKKFEQNLRSFGVATVDAQVVMSKYRQELVAARKEMLGLADASKKVKPPTLGGRLKEIGTGALRSVGERAVALPGQVASGAVGMVESLASHAVEAGKQLTEAVWHAATFRQNTLMGLSYMLKSEEKAREVFTFAQKMAIASPMKTEELVSTFKSFVTAHYSVDEAKVLTKAVADVRSLNLEKPEIADHAAFVFSHILGSGRATQRHLSMLQAGGMNQMDVIKSLSKMEIMQPQMKGYHGKSDMELSVYMRKLMSKSQVGSRTLMQATINALEERSGSGVGTLAKQKGTETLTGVASTLKSAFWDLLESDAADLANSESMKALMAFMNRLVEAISPFSDQFEKSGGKILNVVKSITDALFGGLDRISQGDIEDVVGKVEEMSKKVVGFLKEAWGWFDKLIHGDVNVGDDLGDVLMDIGTYIGEGVLAGMKEGALGVGASEKKFISKYGFGSEDAKVFASGKGFRGDAQFKDFLAQYQELLPKFYAAGAAGEVDSSGSGVELMDKVWKFAQTVDVVDQHMRDAAQRQSLLDTLDTGQYGAGKGGGGFGDLAIPKFGDGAMVTSPTLAWVGESGPEAVVPLRTMSGEGYSPLSYTSQSSDGKGGGMRGGIGSLTVNVSVASLSGMGDPTQAANTIADITVERLMLAVLERKALEA